MSDTTSNISSAARIRRVNALKNIQVRYIDLETKFYEELHELECKYATRFTPIFEERRQIVCGEREPSEQEAKWTYDDDELKAAEAEESLERELAIKCEISDEAESGEKGVSDFWLQTLKSTQLVAGMIQEQDEPVLKFLRDIRVIMKTDKPYGYTLEFEFAPNEYFTNKVLTKTYELTCERDEQDPFSYDGPVMYKAVGCEINWNQGKNVTISVIKKKQKHKKSGSVRVVSKEEKTDSFFNFFETPTVDGLRPSFRANANSNKSLTDNVEQQELDEQDEELLEFDFEIGHFFKEFIVPKATLYFTGDLVEDEYDEEEMDEDDFDELDDDEDEDDDVDEIEEQVVSEVKNVRKKRNSNSKTPVKTAGKLNSSKN